MKLFIALAITALASVSASYASEDQSNSGTNITAARAKAQAYANAVRRNPSDLRLRKELARNLLEAGLANRAAQQMQTAVKFGLRSADDFCLLADAYRFSGQVNSAISNYMEAVNIKPDHAHAKAGMALCYMSAGFAKTGERVCQQALTKVSEAEGKRELLATLKSIRDSVNQTQVDQLAANEKRAI